MRRYHARWVLPVAAPPVPDGTVAVGDDGRIAYVGPRAGAPRGADLDLGDAVLGPGLVNVHTHLELTAMRGFLEGLPFREWIRSLTAAKRATQTRPMLLDAARFGVAEGLRAGITTFADTSDAGVVLEALADLGARGVMYQEVFGPDPAHVPDAMAALRARVADARAWLAAEPDLRSPRRRLRVGVSPHAPYSVCDALYAAVAALARDEGLPVAAHVAESAAEDELVRHAAGPFADALRERGIAVAPRGDSTVALLEATGLLAERPLLIHGVRMTPADVARVAAAGASVAHCPASNAKLGHGLAPLAAWLAAGVPVGLGTDSVASNNRMDLLDEARLAALVSAAVTGDPAAADPAVMLRLATAGGARALGLADVGVLAPGMQADLAAFPLDAGPAAVPLHDPAAALLFALPGVPARLVLVEGEPRVEEGRVLGLDPALAGRVQAAADQLAGWRAAAGGPAAPAPVSIG